MQPDHPGRFERVDHGVPGADPAGVTAQLRGEHGDEAVFTGLSATQRPERGEMLLFVQQQALVVDLAVEVDGQLGNPQQRPLDPKQPGAAARDADPARQAQIAVEPRVEQRAAVDLHT